VPYIFKSKKGNHFTIRLTNFALDTFAIGGGVTFLIFMTKGKEYLFSIYNHSDPGWTEFPFSESPFYQNVNLDNERDVRLFVPLGILLFLLIMINESWVRNATIRAILWPLFFVTACAFYIYVWLRKRYLRATMRRLQDHVEFK